MLASASVAIASIAFFRPWIEFTIGNGDGGAGELGKTGADIAGETSGLIPWLYVTPVFFLIVLAVSGFLLFARSRVSRITASLIICTLAVALVSWPLPAVARIVRSLSRLSSVGLTTMGLTAWWWVYCLSLVVIIVSGIIEFTIAVRKQSL